AFQKEGNKLLLVGKTRGEFGGSLYIKELFGETTGNLNEIDYSAELRLWELVIEANKKELLSSAKDVGMGGLAISLAKMSAVSGLGVKAKIELENTRDIFAESQSRAILEVSPENIQSVIDMAVDLGLHIEPLGEVVSEQFSLNDVAMPVAKLQSIYRETFAKTIEQDL
ncbi:MAG TPA: phosphoribosylformylglycinamidine synthase II, partial [Epsilonproteobacteria bacterium]|nr:phosphoribosylformylglycinamidine synthase II [Campylobacterota bacterium]